MNLDHRASIPAKPRAIEKTHPFFIGRMLAFLVLFVFAAMSVATVGYLVLDRAYTWVGKTASARLIMLREERDPFTGGLVHRATYEIQQAGETVKLDQSAIDWAEYKKFSEPFRRSGRLIETAADGLDTIRIPATDNSQISIQVLEVGPLLLSRAVENTWTPVLRLSAMILAPAALFATWALYFAIIVRPRRTRWLYSQGEVADGVITAKRIISGKYGPTYFGYYAFVPPGQQGEQRGTIFFVKQERYDAVQEGQSITLLYDPEKPKRNVAYDFGGYRWVR